jgi:geranylgeranyl reductase family protein
MQHDVIIVGAGPAGATAALRLARAGVRDVLLLDAATFPRDKTCGSGLSPTSIALMQELGLGDELERRATPVMSVKIVTPGGRAMILASNAEAVVLLRKEFDGLLVDSAQKAGARLETGVRARNLLQEQGRTVGVRMSDGREHRGRFVLCADGAHSIFSTDSRPKRSISTLMGWWDGADFEQGQLEMIFDRNVAPLYGWLFPESRDRVNIGICMEGQDGHGNKTRRNVRTVFQQFLTDHYERRLANARQIGPLKGHPIVYTTWIKNVSTKGALFVGEAARVTHNATGEGISQAMQSGMFAADTVASILSGERQEDEAFRSYVANHRKRFTLGFLGGHALRAVVRTPLLDAVAVVYGHPWVRRGVVRTLGSALAGASVREAGTASPEGRPSTTSSGREFVAPRV